MPNFILTRSSVILCPHGGMIAHVPMSGCTETINGEMPMLFSDTYIAAGCPFMTPYGPAPCHMVIWTNPSVTKFIQGVPVLTSASLGIINSVTGAANGVVIIASHKTRVTD